MFLQAARSNQLKLIVVNEKDLAKLAALEKGDNGEDDVEKSLEDDYSPKAISNTLNSQLQPSDGNKEQNVVGLRQGMESKKMNDNKEGSWSGEGVEIELATFNPVLHAKKNEVEPDDDDDDDDDRSNDGDYKKEKSTVLRPVVISTVPTQAGVGKTAVEKSIASTSSPLSTPTSMSNVPADDDDIRPSQWKYSEFM